MYTKLLSWQLPNTNTFLNGTNKYEHEKILTVPTLYKTMMYGLNK